MLQIWTIEKFQVAGDLRNKVYQRTSIPTQKMQKIQQIIMHESKKRG
ncbi:unnamed protein product [Paramecium octaurelia]|uniref:Uncharacterized protein n=1 Tax=Paramecium octaurelia TaxID=43137 RepID=A0A8S1V809_PAROT|nr:unnamed protein product [Paramecium octaurelia]